MICKRSMSRQQPSAVTLTLKLAVGTFSRTTSERAWAPCKRTRDLFTRRCVQLDDEPGCSVTSGDMLAQINSARIAASLDSALASMTRASSEHDEFLRYDPHLDQLFLSDRVSKYHGMATYNHMAKEVRFTQQRLKQSGCEDPRVGRANVASSLLRSLIHL